MSSKIQSKIHNYGNINESEWPPRFPKKNNAGRYYFDKETQTFKAGSPPDTRKIYGKAPTVKLDSMPKTYHHAAGRDVESRKEWERLDKETGSITFGSQEEAERNTQKRLADEKKALKADRRKASSTALQMHRENPKEMRERLQKQREVQEQTAKKAGLDKIINKTIKETIK